MEPVETERLAHGLQLLDEGRDRPQRRIVRPVGVSAAELVVEDHPPPLPGERPQHLERSVRPARAAVQAEKRPPAGLLSIADDLVPRLPLAKTET